MTNLTPPSSHKMAWPVSRTILRPFQRCARRKAMNSWGVKGFWSDLGWPVYKDLASWYEDDRRWLDSMTIPSSLVEDPDLTTHIYLLKGFLFANAVGSCFLQTTPSNKSSNWQQHPFKVAICILKHIDRVPYLYVCLPGPWIVEAQMLLFHVPCRLVILILCYKPATRCYRQWTNANCCHPLFVNLINTYTNYLTIDSQIESEKWFIHVMYIHIIYMLIWNAVHIQKVIRIIGYLAPNRGPRLGAAANGCCQEHMKSMGFLPGRSGMEFFEMKTGFFHGKKTWNFLWIWTNIYRMTSLSFVDGEIFMLYKWSTLQ